MKMNECWKLDKSDLLLLAIRIKVKRNKTNEQKQK